MSVRRYFDRFRPSIAPSGLGLALAATLLAACGGGTAATSRTAASPALAPTGPREQTADQQVSHVLSRLTFGARPGDVQRVREMGVDRWIDLQLHPERIDDSATDAFMHQSYSLLEIDAAELQRRAPPPGVLQQQLAAKAKGRELTAADSAEYKAAQEATRQLVGEVNSARVSRAAMSQRQLDEVMVDFWLNHFNVYTQKGPQARYHLAEYESKSIRPYALGKFRDLLGAVAKSPAMLFYLDNWQSQADSTRPRLVMAGGRLTALSPAQIRALQTRGGRGGQQPPAPPRGRGGLNENYGRELLELHTLGVDGGYTQADVIDVARALTGWTLQGPRQAESGFNFVPLMHDAGEKKVLGHTLAAGRGIEDGEEVLDIVSKHPSTARYISFKLARYFVSDVPPQSIVDRAAAVFTATDGDIREVVRTIVTSSEFFAQSAYRAKVKTPFQVVVSTLRALDAKPDPTPRTAQLIAGLGQPIFGHQTPDGWPDTGDKWMNTGAILQRINFGFVVAAGRVPGASPLGFAGAEALKNAPLEQQVDGVAAALLGGAVSADTRAVLLSGTNPLMKAAPADMTNTAGSGMNAGMGAPPAGPPPGPPGGAGGPPGPPPGGGPLNRPLPPLKGLNQVIGLALGSPEFQRR